MDWIDFSFLDNRFLLRFILDLGFTVILAKGFYFRKYLNRSFSFTFILFNLVVFFLTSLLQKIEISLGLTFGLFAIFGMLRYRTEAISNREMTYLLTCISLGMMYSIKEASLTQVVVYSCALVGVTALLESKIFGSYHKRKIVYDRIDLVAPGKEGELKSDLEARLGINIKKVDLGNADLLRDTIEITVTYKE